MDLDARPTLALTLAPEASRLSVKFSEQANGSFNVKCFTGVTGLRPNFSKSTATIIDLKRRMKRPVEIAGYKLFPEVSLKVQCEVPEEMRQTVADNILLDWIRLSSPMRKD